MKNLFYFLLILGLLFYSCSKKGQSSRGISDIQLNEAGKLPLVLGDEKPVLKAVVLSGSGVADYNSNGFSLWLEKQTGIKVEYETVQQDAANEKLNLILSSGELPDIFLSMPFNQQSLDYYGELGYLQVLNEYIDSGGYYFNLAAEKTPGLKKTLSNNDGLIYDLPDINDPYHSSMIQKAWIYQPWLDKLGLKMPETLQEYKDVLIAFRDRDPNGNGVKDEIPSVGANVSWAAASVDAFLMNSFVYNDIYTRLFLKDGSIYFGPAQENWREGLRYIRDLYSEKLISELSFTQNAEQFARLGQEDPLVLGVGYTGYLGLFADLLTNESSGYSYKAIPPLGGGPNGRVSVWGAYDAIRRGHFVVSASSKYPELAFRWGDFLMSEEASLINWLGFENINWKRIQASDAIQAVDGGQAEFVYLKPEEILKIENPEDFGTDPKYAEYQTWTQRGATSRPWSLRGKFERGEFKFNYYFEDQTREAMEPYKPDIKNVLPKLVFTKEENQELAEISSSLLNFVPEMIAAFTTGSMDINNDSQWEEYLKNLKNLRYERYVEIYQDSYNRRESLQ